MFKRYKDAFNGKFYKSLTKQLPKLTELYDIIEREMSDKYGEYKRALGVAIPRFGGVKGVEYVESGVKTEFFENKIKYSISSGYIYPVYGAFRSLLKMNDETGEVEWVFDPIEIWNEVGVSIIQNVFETGSNPQLVGKDKQLWLSNYRIVETQSLRKLLSERR